MSLEEPRVLLVDSYDSFTCNLAALCRSSIRDCTIYIVKNDEFTIDQIIPLLPYFSAIIVGPGPGSPEKINDIGFVKDLWKIADAHLLPIFGVCLGLQSLCYEHGAHLQRLNAVKHGQISHIQHAGTDLFDGVGPIFAVRYHSLHVSFDEGGELEQLAWADDEENGRVVMAAKHRSRPFWAVQYHPESIRTTGGGNDVLCNFWKLAQEWQSVRRRVPRSWDAGALRAFPTPWPSVPVPSFKAPTFDSSKELTVPYPTTVDGIVIDARNISVTAVCETFGASDEASPFVLLESAAQPGRFTIIASLQPDSLRINYYTGDSHVFLYSGKTESLIPLGSQDIWSWLSKFMAHRGATGGSDEIPFWGGLVGYFSYELGLGYLGVPVPPESSSFAHPDVNLVLVERSVVIDSATGKVHIQSLIPEDSTWIADTKAKLTAISESSEGSPLLSPSTCRPLKVAIPDKSQYIARIKKAKEYIYSGDSYELCLTAHTRISVPEVPSTGSSSWERYKALRKSNPAPHSAYLRLQPTTLLSSSPERFLSYGRTPESLYQLRPIKGTVRKAPGIDHAAAERLLAGSNKEVAENLMIVDLIRHDLHGTLGDDVEVSKFCSVEEYETVWQLVSVIEGRRAHPDLDPFNQMGLEVLKRSLPPGSMTGAPKKRSVEILQTLEDDRRSVYSGVFGYWCVSGSGDWSVAIRSCFKHSQPSKLVNGNGDHGPTADIPRIEDWVIGAGGAITALSDPEAEWDEMIVKLQSVLRSFGIPSLA